MERGDCTCHEPPLPISRESDDSEWAHDVDEMFAETYHVHYYEHSTDCDGGMTHEATYRPSGPIIEDALCPPHLRSIRANYIGPNRHDLWMYMLRHEPRFGECGTLTVTEPDHAEWSFRTEEGGGHGEIRGCTDPYCAHDKPLRRDLQAEAAGY